MRQIPLSLADVGSLCRAYLRHTRPVDAGELRQAINYGIGKAARAILSVRPQAFAAMVPFALVTGVTEYDLGNFDPPLWKPTRLLVGGGNGQRSVYFKYRSIVDEDYQQREAGGVGPFDVILYDILNGMLARPSLAITASPTPVSVTLAATTGLDVGTLVSIVGAGANQPVPGTSTAIPSTYYGIVVGIAGPTVTLAPTLAHNPTGRPLTPLWRRMLKIASPVSSGLSGSLHYTYDPAKLQADTDLIDPLISDNIDMVVMYAVAQLKRAVGDSDSRDYFQDGQELRSEAMQKLDPAANSNTEAVGSDLGGD